MSDAPGRGCPLHYRYRPGELAAAATVTADAAFVVGGLYGNPEALAAIAERVGRERAGGARVALVFNGDCHWFDRDPATFAAIQATVLAEHALAGNVELELADPDPAAGCGCAYPAFIDDATVARSNRIIEALRAGMPADARGALAALPRTLRLRVGDRVTGVIHGDPESVAGWSFAIETVTDPRAPLGADRVRAWAEEAGVDAFACSHTCLPWAAAFADTVVINNGSAGMPNFAGDPRGLVTRIAAVDDPAADALYAVARGGTRWEAIPVAFDSDRWWHRFAADWPPGSPAHDSYARRIHAGPDFTPAAAQPRIGAARRTHATTDAPRGTP